MIVTRKKHLAERLFFLRLLQQALSSPTFASTCMDNRLLLAYILALQQTAQLHFRPPTNCSTTSPPSYKLLNYHAVTTY